MHCCFNIYRKPVGKRYNDKVSYKDDEIIEIREVIKNNNPKRNRELGDFEYDLAICAWGASVGELCKEGDYAKTFYIKIKDKDNYDKIYNLIVNAEWRELYPMTATPNLPQWQVYKYIKEQLL